uniref:Uncharacterized protein n=1 Tax=Attheya septentrionalis TaxID=420275 RepID=A0A7S2UDD7_9STRA|mmetsp:Transcript_18063/g.32750  ORF Transcript_18063/g.32750 Transcript_18063/m.32750 type:complete len:183 (+) Transcript_18063:246-794(+)|eukprot:CAMPEP_0198299668 /NCGR_PEP_ID=MMETSP1449-20131203/45585_1 /TAXON_ID=420275 /ORGANISM="Attheya septentrionalis, Strain CCMP2084" /LENGTH=182 /DNA_ID=CAMNT_0044001295 /DNA_START=185 /DNA_END=733 /DNA_ORIENTATION=-
MADDNSRFDGLSSLIAFSGISVPPRARFVTQCVASSIFSSLTLGLVTGQAGALLSCGPLVPFITGSWLGYTWGCVSFWRQSKKKAINCARRYPKILSHSLLADFDIEVPAHVNTGSSEEEGKKHSNTIVRENTTSLEQWILDGGVGRLSYAVLAAQSCHQDIIEMQKSERQKIIDAYSSDRD